MRNLVIIGGGGAGLTAALTAKKTNHEANITLITNERLSYSPCALPFVIGGEIDIEKIAKSIEEICESSDINCVIDEAISIDTEKKVVETKKRRKFPYDSLIIATGGIPHIPPIKGVDLENVFTLQRIEDAEKIIKKAKESKSAVVIGAGAVGLEVAAALTRLGLKVTLVEMFDHVLSRCLDEEFSEIIEQKLKEEGIELIMGSCVEEILGDKEVKAVRICDRDVPADIVILGTGIRPNTEIAEKAGIETVDGGIKTDGYMQTNINDVYAAGDCVDSRSLITGRLMLSQLGTTAIRHGMTAGMNSVGGYATFEGVLNSIILKIFDLEIGRTGLTEKDAKEEEIEIVTGRIKSTTKSEYYPESKEIDVKLIFNALNRRVIGAQMIGGGEVAGKIDLAAFAIAKNACIEDIMKLKYCYTPPLTPSHNALVLAAENAFKKLRRIKEERKRRF